MAESRDLSETLDALKDPDWVSARLKAATRTPGKKRTEIRLIIESPRVTDHSNKERVETAQRLFGRLDAKGRQRFWESLFPRLAQHIERGWVDAAVRPYPTGSSRAPFRAPGRDSVAAENRARLVVEVCDALRGLDPDAEWLAAWAPHVPHSWWGSQGVGWLLSAILRGGGADAEAVRSVLMDSMNGDHEIGAMGQHVPVALLNSEEPGDWEAIGKLLLAAQRQEGLRQSILEVVDEAHPDAFRYMLGVVAEHDLHRFAAVVRAFDVWLGLAWAAASQSVVRKGIQRLMELLDSEQEVTEVIQRADDPEDVYLALWVTAFRDAEKAVPLAGRLLAHDAPEIRYVALRTLDRVGLFPDTLAPVSKRVASGAEDDPRMQMALVRFLGAVKFAKVSTKLWDATVKLFHATPTRKKKLEPLLWPWVTYTQERGAVAHALQAMAVEVPEKLIPFASELETYTLARWIGEVAGTGMHWVGSRPKERKRRKLSPEARELMIRLTGDRRQDVQRAAFEALAPLPVEPDEVAHHLSVLHRSAGALRSGAIARLIELPDAEAVAAAETLIEDKNEKKRAAGIEILVGLADLERAPQMVRDAAERHRERLAGTDLESTIASLLEDRAPAASLEDCLGLVPPGSRVDPVKPASRGAVLETAAARSTLTELGALFIEHGDTEMEVSIGESGEYGTEVRLLTTAGWAFPRPRLDAVALEDARARLPLVDTWLEWLNDPQRTRDADGLEVVRALTWMNRGISHEAHLPESFRKLQAWNLKHGFSRFLHWMALLSDPAGAGAFLVQYVEDMLANGKPSPEEQEDAGNIKLSDADITLFMRMGAVREVHTNIPRFFRAQDNARLGQLAMLAMDRGGSEGHTGPRLTEFLAAYGQGLFNDRDFVWLLLHERQQPQRAALYFSAVQGFGPIREVTGMRPPESLEAYPALVEAAREVRERVVAVELERGDRPGPATGPAALLRYAGGAANLLGLAAALGKDKIVRQHQWGEPTRAFSFSRLMSVTAPEPEDTAERFTELVQQSNLKPARLLELALFAPQWAGHVEATLDFPHLEDAVWWIHAHTKRRDYWRGSEVRDLWAARIAERSELDADDLEEGAVDVAWFTRVIDQIGGEAWDKLQAPAKFASNSGGHKRAQLFANAMLGRVDQDGLLDVIKGKRHQDSVRALGLIPLPEDPEAATDETLARYVRMQEFKRESRKFGSQRQASEGKAVEIGLHNLARTAGYRDPGRLQWAMEAEAVRDLALGPVSHIEGEVTVTLELDETGAPEFSVTKAGKSLKNVPAKLRKLEPIVELRSRVRDLKRQRSRMRHSLERSMCRGEQFTGQELTGFFEHPMLRPVVERLVLVTEDGTCGYPSQGGRALRDPAGALEAVGKAERVRIAHALDLLERGDWSDWQRECFQAERVQPFKQVFREVYPKTAAEREPERMTRRYAGHQVNPRQALALLKTRQWVSEPGEAVRKTYHDEGLVAQLWFQEAFYTPADVEDLTLEAVSFRTRGKEPEPVLLPEVPDRVFSETMRDLDLAVSVAHAGGVDPEASHSTVEMRAALVGETLQLLGIDNVRVEERHALIDGSLGNYSVHLGSANAAVLPGRALFIVAVHSQWRGRLFLPFADDDPKTAEVLAKTLLLARDEEIKDPRILDQIRH